MVKFWGRLGPSVKCVTSNYRVACGMSVKGQGWASDSECRGVPACCLTPPQVQSITTTPNRLVNGVMTRFGDDRRLTRLYGFIICINRSVA